MNKNIQYTKGFFKPLFSIVLLGTISSLSAYELIDLGENVVPHAINNNGVIVGSSNVNQYPSTAFSWSSANGFDILKGTSANAVNDEGQIVGNTITGAFILNGNKYREWSEYGAFGNNQNGEVSGYKVGQNPYEPRSLPYNPAIYNGKTWKVFDIAGIYPRGTRKGVYADRFILNGINAEGYTVGYKYRYGLVGSSAILIDPNITINDLSDVVYLATPAGGKAIDINDNNLIVGTTGSNSRVAPAIYSQAYIYDYDMDNLQILPLLDGGLRSNAYDINENNQVVGSSETLINSITVNHAFLWSKSDGALIDLNTLLATPGWILKSANAINDNGDIVGIGTLNGIEHGFLISTSLTSVSNEAPVAVANADVYSGKAPLIVNFNSSDSTDIDGTIVSYNWDFSDGYFSTEVNPTHKFIELGTYMVTLTVTDDNGMEASNSITIVVRKGKRK